MGNGRTSAGAAGVIATVVVMLCLGACGSDGGSGSAAPATGGDAPAADASAVRRYGYAPTNDAKLQSDVVVIGGGAGAIRSASADGLTWTIDAGADGAADLRRGSIMFATSEAVGRVVAVHDDGDSRVVTIAPVELNDVLRDGTIRIDRAFDLGRVAFQPVPALPGAESEPTAADTGGISPVGERALRAPVIRLVAVRATDPGSDELPVPSSGALEVPVGAWTIKPYAEAGKLGVNVSHGEDEGLKLGVDFAFPVENFHVSSTASVRDGLLGRSDFLVEGVKGMDITLQGGVANGGADNSKVAIQVPIEIDIPIPPSPATAGIPLTFKIEYSLAIETALTGKNSTLFASGSYKLDGPFGVRDGSLVAPTFSVEKSIIDSLGGITLGPSGVVVAVKAKLLAGLGPPAVTAGPFGSINAAIGVTNGSALGASLVRCRGASLDLEVGGGVELSIAPAVLDGLEKLLPAGTKLTSAIEKTENVLHREQVVPDVPLCNQGAS